MLEEKFTKGEWKLSFELCDDGAEKVSIKAGEQTILAGCGCCGSPFARNVNDLHLIAAAPEMYNFLDDLLRNHDLGVDMDDEIEKLLAKARGESC